MNDYESRKQEKIDRLRERAAKADREAESRFGTAREIGSHIPLGQPILVGHHSEGRHRRDLKRIDSNMRKGSEAFDKANRLRGRADSTECNTDIMSDDPEAIVLLEAKIESATKARDEAKRINREYRKAKGDLSKMDLSDEMRARVEKGVELAKTYMGGRFRMDVSGLTANIRRLEGRLNELKAMEERADTLEITGDGWAIEEHPEEGRIWVTFDKKPPRETSQLVRSYGFTWSPRRKASVRKLTANALRGAKRLAEALSPATERIDFGVVQVTLEAPKTVVGREEVT